MKQGFKALKGLKIVGLLALFGYILTQAVIQGVNGLIIFYLNTGIAFLNSFIPKHFNQLM